MDIKTLMIGDWVECTYWTPSKQLKVAEIRRVMDDEIKIGVYSNDLVLIFRQSEVNPIPLTPEILEKNGFVPKFSDGCLTEYLIYKDIVDGLHEMYIKIFSFNTKEKEHKLECFNCRTGGCQIWIKYVHQLQHALRLCGINKEIVL